MSIKYKLTLLLPFYLLLFYRRVFFRCLEKYYTFVRLAVFLGSIFLANKSIQKGNHLVMVFLIAVALLFNPLFQVHFTRKVWNIIDIMLAIIFLFQGIKNLLAERKTIRMLIPDSTIFIANLSAEVSRSTRKHEKELRRGAILFLGRYYYSTHIQS